MLSLQGLSTGQILGLSSGYWQPQKTGRKGLFPTQCDDDFLLSANKDHVAVFDRLDRDLMNSAADLQSELLAFTHYSAIDDGVTAFRIENNA